MTHFRLSLLGILIVGQATWAGPLDDAAALTKAQLQTLVNEGSQCTSSLSNCPVLATCATTVACTTFVSDFQSGANVWGDVWEATQGTPDFDEIDNLMRSAAGEMESYEIATSASVCGKVQCRNWSNTQLLGLCTKVWTTSECYTALGP